MKLLSVILIVLASAACGRAHIEETAAHVRPGYYKADNVDSALLPLVAVTQSAGQTYSYSMLKYECRGELSSQFEQSGVVADLDPEVVGGPRLFVAGYNCSVSAKIEAHSDSILLVTLTINGVKQIPYVLTKTTQETFIDDLRGQAEKSVNFDLSDRTCKEAFGKPCADLQLSAKARK
jgi:hypothetical protein